MSNLPKLAKIYMIPKYMSNQDRQQLRVYSKQLDKLSSGEHCQQKAIQYVREDVEINDLNYHLKTLVI